jgi:hypothetical protein
MASDQSTKSSGWFMTRLEHHPLLIGSAVVLAIAITVAVFTFVMGVLTSR